MDLKVSSSKPRGISPSDSDFEEKEFSDDNDDDRNHKHRRREMESQSSGRDVMDQAFSRPFRKQYKPYKNGQSIRETDSQSSEGWKRFNNAPMEKDLSTFDKTRTGFPTFSRAPTDLSQRIIRDSWSRGAASQMVHQGSFPPNLFPGRRLPNVSNTQIAPWNAFGYSPGLTNGGVNLGISHQRCRDFEERGFCLRGDMCPMEHGVNRIVIEDVQASGLKNEEAIEQPMKRHKAGTTSDFAKRTTPTDAGTLAASPKSGRVADKKKVVDNGAVHSSNPTSAMVTQEPTSLKQSIRASPPEMSPFSVKRFKLDNRPTTFRIMPPLPAGLANVSVLKEHFSSFGDLSNVELEDQAPR